MGHYFEDLSFSANYYEGINALGGTLYIYDDVAVFRPHAINFGDPTDRIIPIRDIFGYKKGFLSIFHIYLNNGKDIKLAVWKKNAIINALEIRRQAIYEQKAPPLIFKP